MRVTMERVTMEEVTMEKVTMEKITPTNMNTITYMDTITIITIIETPTAASCW